MMHYGCNDAAKPFPNHWSLCDSNGIFAKDLEKTLDIDSVTCQNCLKKHEHMQPLLEHTHFLYRGKGFVALQIPCKRSLEYAAFGPIPSTVIAAEVTCPRCQKYLARQYRLTGSVEPNTKNGGFLNGHGFIYVPPKKQRFTA